MNISIGSKQAIINFIQGHTILFRHFESIYLFGSSIKEDSIPHDIDLLLVYSMYRDGIIENIDLISTALESELHMPIDLTVLSNKELESTDFLNKIKLYQKLR